MSIASSVESTSDNIVRDIPHDLPHRGSFYRCDDVNQCGMRFPVVTGDPFRGHCPRCGAPAHPAVTMKADETPPFAESMNSSLRAMATQSRIHLLLDNWRSLFNVGAAFRTADGAGVEHLYLCGITATPAQPKLAKTALGAEQAVAWSYHADATLLAAALQKVGAQIWVLERSPSARPLFDVTSMPSDCPVVLTAGNEVAGVDPDLVALADQVIQLPMLGRKRSLNVAVALSIATYWLRAQPPLVMAEQEIQQRAGTKDVDR